MAESNEQQSSVPSAFKKEDAYQSLEIINTWISNIDSKVSFALALVGVLMGFIFSQGVPSAFETISKVQKLADLGGAEIIAGLLVSILYLSSLGCILCLVMAIVARTKETGNVTSAFFFGTISAMTLQDYKNKVGSITDEQLLEEVEEQIHTNSKICTLKSKWYNRGIKFLAVTIVLWFVCMVFQLI